MATNIEIEAKVLITEADYKKAVDKYKPLANRIVTHTNYYIDTPEFELKKHGVGLRIREKNGDYTLTLKAPMAEGLLENKETILKKDFEDLSKKGIFPSGEICKFVKMIGVNPEKLRILTFLVTDRIDIYNDDRTIFSIDKNIYNGIIDYELEMEGNSMNLAVDALRLRCEDLDIPFIENKQSKQTRAFNTIIHKELKNNN